MDFIFCVFKEEDSKRTVCRKANCNLSGNGCKVRGRVGGVAAERILFGAPKHLIAKRICVIIQIEVITMKKLAILIAFIMLFSLTGCSQFYDQETDAVDGWDVGYSDYYEDAYLGLYNWDGSQENMNIVMPEKYKGYKVTKLGGYSGSGYPSVVKIEPTDDAKKLLCNDASEWYHMNHISNIENSKIKFVTFNVHVSKNIKEIQELDLGGFIGGKYIKDGKEYYDIYVLLCNVTCDESNETFYAKEGKLYYKQDDTLVSDIVYTDFNLEKHIEEHKDEVHHLAVF